MIKISKILIANRGEIAVRIIKTVKKMGIQTVGVFASDDHDSLHVKMADQVVNLGSGMLKDTYLNISRLISTAKEYNCDAIHPGYGFLSENHLFAKACSDNDIIFIGPSSEIIRLMGNKTEACKYVESLGIPVPFSLKGSVDDLLSLNGQVKFPCLVKAVAGGGGKAMRKVLSANGFKETIESASREAETYFGNGEIYLEEYIEDSRHIEVQILGDNFGNIVHLFDRECSVQRRYQKIIEEASFIGE